MAVTGLKVPKVAALRIDPTRPSAEQNRYFCRVRGEPR
jgi:hypothetical protein